ncbi:TPR repeat protein [Flavobacterium sp. 7E]|uniref:T9SS type A sorting domain-containing protein n=1 Tax=Flavobacterium sp. 7E TaxID=2735898 RepID=UPI00156FC5CB|nr:T9SS type A sorting domain-containing protein [Flavobacterium sp. 7E]NRS87714.1 TPR repeat protein [Flavobacterium sp. 7E]
MKKTITKRLILSLLLSSTHCFSQTEANETNLLATARLQLLEGQSNSSIHAAIQTFHQQANLGNAEAMNGLAQIYTQGLGVTKNENLALEWFEKAAQSGYAKAYFNLATLYKEGVIVSKDETKAVIYFEKAAKAGDIGSWSKWGEMVKNGQGITRDYTLAMEIFKLGAAAGSPHCIYAQGYLYYKGFGVEQDYGKALTFFQQAANLGNPIANYMVGYCYRNGYGISIDYDEAKVWFNKAADLGFERSEKELGQPLAENAVPNQNKTQSTPIAEEIENAPITVPKKMQKVKHNIRKGSISGVYTGQLLRYDWSGQNIISKTSLEITIDQQEQILIGTWKEQEADSVTFQAILEEKKIVFKDSKIDRVPRSGEMVMRSYKFKEAKLQLLEHQDDLYIVGNLQLYDSKEHENEKPMYLILERKIKANENQEIDETIPANVSKVVVYPNPITSNSFQLSYELTTPTEIIISIYDFNGLLKSSQKVSRTSSGIQEHLIPMNLPAGYYILNLNYNNQVIKTILIKK